MLVQTPTTDGGRLTGGAWSARPRLSLLLRAIAFAAPIGLSVVATMLVNRWLPQTTTLVGQVVLWVLLSGVATSVLFVADRGARKLLPLAALLKLPLIFPDHAPSRYKVALRTGTVHQLEQQVADIKRNGFADDQTQAAEQLLELVAALSAHDRITRGHAERVRAYARLIGEELGLSDADVSKLHWAALLHDVGKLFVPGEILNKPGTLTHDEYEIIKLHPGWGAELCEPLRGWLGEWVDAVGQHHEWWDGHGYPNGLAGHDIALAARIVSVADVFDVITSARSYKRAEGVADAREELARCAGTQFEPRVVRAFLTVSLGRLRLVMGPLSSLAHLPGLGRIPISGLSAAASGLVTAGALLVGGVLHQPTSAEPTARREPLVATPRPAAQPVVDRGVDAPPPDAPTPPTPPVTPPTPPASPVDPIIPPVLAPVTIDDDVTTLEDIAVVVDVLANDVGADEVTWVGAPDHGTTSVVAGGVRYQPAGNAVARATFSYGVAGPTGVATGTVTVSVLPVNDSPTFSPGANVVVAEDTGAHDLPGWATDVRTGPADESAQSVTFVVATADPALFSAPPTVDATGRLRFTAAPEAWGSTTVSVTAVDDGGTAFGGIDRSAPRVFTLTVTSVNDLPQPVGDTATVLEDGSVTIAVLANDSDPEGDTLTVTGATSPYGAATTDGTTVTYTPAPDSNGSQALTYSISDGTDVASAAVTIIVTPVNDAPSFVAGADVSVPEDSLVQTLTGWASAISTGPSDEAGQSVAFVLTTADPSLFDVVPALDASGTLTFTPHPNAYGTTTVDVVGSDDGGTLDGGDDTADGHVLTITLTATPDAPVASDDAYSTMEGIPLLVPAPGVLANDGDEDGDPLSTTLALPPASGGTVVLLPDGSFEYTPLLGFTGMDSFTYTVSDGTQSSTGTVTILVSSSTTTSTFYLANQGAGPEDWVLTGTAPSSPSADPDGDGNPGLTVKSSGGDLNETDIRKYHQWRYLASADLTLYGPVTLGLWSTADDFGPNDDVDYSIWLQDCAANGTGCVTLSHQDDIHVDRWNRGVAGWTYREISLGNIDHTVATGRILQVRVMFGHHDVWIATDPSKPSTLTFTQPV